ncbi:leucine-rich repeats and immunoglobulin-like domains protein 1 isoform X8 [Myotis myotis]|uniref:leucine-rich repeats and immunoglobulin-like domains protein 1 isoform X8 n=1 Tax=Myotis myotis TaxID=51298 RepID=UPI00174CFE27|nr:leucine-rich repeats and immunoglobulin-like domains protein 1 isoform X8 [Myotis myotis]
MAQRVRGALGAPRRRPRLLPWLLLLLLRPEPARAAGRAPCPAVCTCAGDSLDCGGRGLAALPGDLPAWTQSLNLSYNKLSEIDPAGFEDLPNLQEVFGNTCPCKEEDRSLWGQPGYLNNNELTAIPSLGAASSHIMSLFLQHNKIRSVEGRQLRAYLALEVLDLSWNNLTEVHSACFLQGPPLKELNLASNRIGTLESGAFDGLSRSLLTLRLSRNRITQLPVKAFKLPRLTQLDLNRNRIRLIEGLTFQGLDSLEVLKLQRNNISRLTDGAFWGLSRMQALHLEHNSLGEVNSGSLYGLTALHQLHLSNNSISRISRDGWSFCQKLHELSLSFNNLTRLDEGSLADLSSLSILRLSHNSISHIAEGAFKGLRNLRVLDLGHNEISGTIEDTSGAFTGLDSLSKLSLSGNKIKSVAKRAFSGLDSLEHLNLGENAIRSVQFDAFAKMRNLKELRISSESFLCDCQLRWLPSWLLGRTLQASVTATCAHPEALQGQSIFSVPPESFVCEDLPKPQIITQPETTVAVVGRDVRFTCSAASSSSSPMTFAWKKDSEVLADADMENFAHVRAQDGEVMEYTTILHLRHVTFGHEGRYQCIITNHFGSTYSHKARLTVNVLPSFTKMPHDIAIRTGTMARLECAATGHPNPQIAWQKDGGTDFPAARERRMHVMPDDDVFFITDVKLDDMGVYSCTAQNLAGSISANATLTVLDETVVPPDVPSYLSSQGTLSDRQDTVLRTEGGHQANGHVESNGVCPRDAGLFPEADAPSIACRPPRLCVGYSKEPWRATEKAAGTPGPQKMEPSGPAVSSDSHTDVDSYSKEHAFCPQPTSRDSTQPGTLSSQEPRGSDREHSPRLDSLHSGAGDGSPPDCRESLYPSNHDRMLPPWKRKPGAPPEGKGAPPWMFAGVCEPDCIDPQPSTVTQGSSELTRAVLDSPDAPSEGRRLLLLNGHIPKAGDSGPESTPLTGQLPGKRSGPLLFAPRA